MTIEHDDATRRTRRDWHAVHCWHLLSPRPQQDWCPRLNFPHPLESSLSWVPPPFLAREDKTAGGEDSRMIVASLVITDHQIPMLWESLHWAPPPPHAASSSSVLIFIASNGGSPLLLPVMFVVSLASRSEYSLTCIASATFTFVVGFALHAMKKRVAFSARSLTWYSFLFKDMLKCLLLRGRKQFAGTMHTGERETIVVKPQYRLRTPRLWRTDPHHYESANNPWLYCRPQNNNQCWKSRSKNKKIKIICATLVMPNLA